MERFSLNEIVTPQFTLNTPEEKQASFARFAHALKADARFHGRFLPRNFANGGIHSYIDFNPPKTHGINSQISWILSTNVKAPRVEICFRMQGKNDFLNVMTAAGYRTLQQLNDMISFVPVHDTGCVYYEDISSDSFGRLVCGIEPKDGAIRYFRIGIEITTPINKVDSSIFARSFSELYTRLAPHLVAQCGDTGFNNPTRLRQLAEGHPTIWQFYP